MIYDTGYHSFNPIWGKRLCPSYRCYKRYKVCFLLSVTAEFKEKIFLQENNLLCMGWISLDIANKGVIIIKLLKLLLFPNGKSHSHGLENLKIKLNK